MKHRGIFPTQKKLVVIGDIHGDFKKLLCILEDSGVIKKKLNKKCISEIDYDCDNWTWIAEPKTMIVQVGDIFDGGGRSSNNDDFEDMELETYNFLIKLKKKALQHDGDVILCIGNHEIMNFQGNYKYVTDSSMGRCLNIEKEMNDVKIEYNLFENKRCDDRDELFKVGGYLGRSMAKYMYGIVQIGKNIICHAGLDYNLALKYDFDLSLMNKVLKAYLSGNLNNNDKKNEYVRNAFDEIYGSEGLIWHRDIAYNEPSSCNNMQKTLDNLKILDDIGAERMIVGHTLQPNGIAQKCENEKKRLWVIDVGMSDAFNINKKKIEYLVIEGDNKPEIKECEILYKCN